MQFNIAIHETKDTDFCFDIEYIKGINELDVEGKRPEMKKGMEKELMKTVDMKERAPPSQLDCLLGNEAWDSRLCFCRTIYLIIVGSLNRVFLANGAWDGDLK